MFLLCFFPPFLEKGILDYIAHRLIIQVFTVVRIEIPVEILPTGECSGVRWL